MAHHEYETIVIIRPDIDDAAITAVAEKLEGVISAQGGHNMLRDDWGKKRMAYPIQKHQKGHYILFSFLSEATGIEELERIIRIDDSMLRFLTVRKAAAVDIDTRLQEAAEQRRLRDEAEAARKEADAIAAKEAADAAAAAEKARLARAAADAEAAAEAAAAAGPAEEEAEEIAEPPQAEA